MTLARIAMPSPNYSSRSGSGVRLIVCHTAEGALSIESLGGFFASSSSGVSSHAGADDKANTIGVYVKRADKAWTQGNANPYCVSIELCAFAAWTTDQWHQHPNMLANCAAWIAEEAAAFGIPIRALSAAEAQGGGAGVCQHVDLGQSHWDCGPGFPMAEVISMAQGGAPPPTDQEFTMDAEAERAFNELGAKIDSNGAGQNAIYTAQDSQSDARAAEQWRRMDALNARIDGMVTILKDIQSKVG